MIDWGVLFEVVLLSCMGVVLTAAIVFVILTADERALRRQGKIK